MHPAMLLEQFKARATAESLPLWVIEALDTLYKETYHRAYRDGVNDMQEEDDEAQEDRS